jgi:hypothetical protein
LKKYKNMYKRNELAERLSKREAPLPYGLLANEYEDIIKHLQYQNKIRNTKGFYGLAIDLPLTRYIKKCKIKINKRRNHSTNSPLSS